MLHSTPRPGLSRDREDALLHAEPDYISFLDISRFLRRNRMLILGCLAVTLSLAAFYLATAQRTFSARSQILIDPNATELIRDTNPGAQGRSLDTAQVEGQIALLRSESLAYSVIGKLQLLSDPEFQSQPPSFFRQLLNLAKTVFALGEPDSPVAQVNSPEHARQRTALDIFLGNLDVRRVSTSYAIDITYTSPDPEKAALIANTVAESYIDDQRKNMSRAAQQSSEWLEARLYQLRSQLNTAARQLELFRAGRDIRPLDQRRDVPAPAPLPGASDVGARDRAAGAPTQRDTVSRGSVSPPGEITLAELESTTESYRKIYEAYQQAFTEAVQRQSFPVTNTRVITAATKPLGKSSPRSQLIIMFAMLVGLLLGVAASVLRESVDNTVRSARQVRTKIGLPCLAVIPRIDRQALLAGAEHAMSRLRKGSRPPQAMKGRPSPDYNFRVAIDVPFSPFSSAMKNLRTAIAHADPRNPMRCIGITSSMPREGKSMVSGNLATLYALSSGRTLIIDADIHNSTLSRHYAPGVAAGLLEVVTGVAELDRAIVKGSGFVPDILPIAVKETAPVSYEQLASEKMQTLLHVLRERYDMIIVDLPPVHPIVDGVAIGALLDGVVVVAEWGRAPVELVAEVRSTLYTAQANVLGVVITKADASAATVRWRKDWGYGYYPSARAPRPGAKG
jgi:capsular exopolysaccharide synthesis family protein